MTTPLTTPAGAPLTPQNAATPAPAAAPAAPAHGERRLFGLWTFALAGPRRYRLSQWLQRFFLRHMVRSQDGWITRLPGPASGWTQGRDFPRPPAKSFRELWKERRP